LGKGRETGHLPALLNLDTTGEIMGSMGNHEIIAAHLRPTLKRVASGNTIYVARDYLVGPHWIIRMDVAPRFLQNVVLTAHDHPVLISVKIGNLRTEQRLTVTDTVKYMSSGPCMILKDEVGLRVMVNAYYFNMFAGVAEDIFWSTWANVGIFRDGECLGAVARMRG